MLAMLFLIFFLITYAGTLAWLIWRLTAPRLMVDVAVEGLSAGVGAGSASSSRSLERDVLPVTFIAANHSPRRPLRLPRLGGPLGASSTGRVHRQASRGSCTCELCGASGLKSAARASGWVAYSLPEQRARGQHYAETTRPALHCGRCALGFVLVTMKTRIDDDPELVNIRDAYLEALAARTRQTAADRDAALPLLVNPALRPLTPAYAFA